MQEIFLPYQSSIYINEKNKPIVWFSSHAGIRYLIVDKHLKFKKKNSKLNYTNLAKQIFFFKKFLKKQSVKKKNVLDIKSNLMKTYFENTILGNTLCFIKRLSVRDRKPEWFVKSGFLCVQLVDMKKTVKFLTPSDFQQKIYKRTMNDKRKNSEQARILLKSTSLIALLQFASLFRKLRKPNPYTGKGIRYLYDIVQNRMAEKNRVLARKKKKP